MLTIFTAKQYFSHWLNAVDEHSVHSPFFFDFYQKVVGSKNTSPATTIVHNLRNNLTSNKTIVDYQDIGSNSPHFSSPKRTIGDIATTSLLPEKWCQLLFRTSRYVEATNIIELGTSMGLTTLHLAQNPKSVVHTFEGNRAMVNIAQTNFESLGVKNIRIIDGNIDQSLPNHLQNPAKVHFAFIDANHRYKATVTYFEILAKRMADKGVIVLDDIHLTPEMHQAWNELKHHDLVYGSIDLFRMGILFFDLSLNKQHYTWRY